MSRTELICNALIAQGKWTKAQCELCSRMRKEKCKILTEKNYIKSDLDRDYDRTIDREMNDSEHKRLYL